jgi:integrase
MHAYITLSLLAGIRTEEARALRWAHVDLDGDPAARPPVPPHVAVWRSVRAHGETKTERSRRTLGLPVMAVQALRAWSGSQAGERNAAGEAWQDTGLVFTTHNGAALNAKTTPAVRPGRVPVPRRGLRRDLAHHLRHARPGPQARHPGPHRPGGSPVDWARSGHARGSVRSADPSRCELAPGWSARVVCERR